MASTQRERVNWLIHTCYVRQDHDECLKIIEQQLLETAFCEYPIYVKALILRQRGQIQDSLSLFQSATCLNPHNTANLKQVGHSLYLLGKHKQAIEVYDEARRISEESSKRGSHVEDWELLHNKGLCFMYLKQYDAAADCFKKANGLQRHDATYMQLGKCYEQQEKFQEALRVYQDALDFSPENPELLTTMGLLWLRQGDSARAVLHLGNAMTHDPRSAKAILGWGSITQDNQDMDVALVKYRIAAVATPNSAQLWNNIGMCFFGKGHTIAAVSCLKRAAYLAPFEWIICYNLGLVHLNGGQHASAFRHFHACINLKADYAASYMFLAITLARLKDFPNACAAYEKAIAIDPNDHVTHLNYAITLFNHGDAEKVSKGNKIKNTRIGHSFNIIIF
jgi:Bardet-Biedl syndrome 4 protein